MSEPCKEQPEVSIKLYKYRWVILFVYCLFTAVNFAQYLEYSIIANIIQKYYGTTSIETDLTGLLFPIIYLVAFIPCSYYIKKTNLRTASITASGLTTSANLLKLLSLSEDRFYVVLIAQALCGLAQVFLVTIPTKVACTWFGPKEVSTACAIGVLGSQLGVALGCAFPTAMVKNSDSLQDIHDDLFIMLLCYAVITSVIFLITLILFKAKPALPPSLSQLNLVDNSEDPPKVIASMKIIFKKKEFVLLLIAFGVSNGIWTSLGVLFNKFYLEYFPNSEEEAGILALASVICGGCIGSVIFGYILDKTNKFRIVSFVVIFAAAVSYVGVTYILEIKSKFGTYFTIPLLGFFLGSTLVVAYEYILEVTYPVPEETSCSIINAVIFLSSLIFTFTFEGLYDAIGYLNTNICINVILFICSLVVILVNSDLHRRDANQNSIQ